jgi:hypothetical protein
MRITVPRKLPSMFQMSMASLMIGSAGTCDLALAMGTLPDVPVVINRCPVLKDYDPAVTAKAAAELRALLEKDPKAATPGLVRDYRVLRDQCRAIEQK